MASTKMIHRWLHSDAAATGIEYALLAGGIALAIVTVVTQIGTGLDTLYADVAAGFP